MAFLLELIMFSFDSKSKSDIQYFELQSFWINQGPFWGGGGGGGVPLVPVTGPVKKSCSRSCLGVEYPGPFPASGI